MHQALADLPGIIEGS